MNGNDSESFSILDWNKQKRRVYEIPPFALHHCGLLVSVCYFHASDILISEVTSLVASRCFLDGLFFTRSVEKGGVCVYTGNRIAVRSRQLMAIF